MKLLVAIPCLNEAASIASVIEHVPRSLPGLDEIQVLIVDDGSTDDTASAARRAGATVISHPVNRGVGVAFHSAVAYATDRDFDVMVNIDGDGQFDPADIPRLLAPILGGEADLVTASRFVDSDYTPAMPRIKRVGNYAMARLISRLCGKAFSDVSCGFRAYSREALLQLNLHGEFTYTQETFLDLTYKKLRIAEVPIHVRYFADRRSRVVGNIWRYGINTGMILLRAYRDYFPLRFFLGVAAAFFALSAGFGVVFFGYFFATGTFTGYFFAGLLSAFFFIVGLIFAILAVVADMLDRVRVNQERTLYLLKKLKR